MRFATSACASSRSLVAPNKDLRVEPLDAKRHDRLGFTCGVERLDAYLETQASQDVRRKANAVLVLVETAEPATIRGYFTLCAYGLTPGNAVTDVTWRLTRRAHLPILA